MNTGGPSIFQDPRYSVASYGMMRESDNAKASQVMPIVVTIVGTT